ncbi:FecR family protein [Thermoflavifilum thermophilum]|uniref:FecR family protein n=1 Tax=Thermoflavifilum thermophilum TaxID=1393122 RepID=A0A1I7NC35_9BACT|nr:FecR family protein [Thermoflavifilum thermophilum]SFV32244.1 FecR family protein [Thermoflavifilum thermophilum]
MEAQDRIWELMARKVSGEAAPEELEELDEWMKNHPEAHYVLETLMQAWHPTPESNERVKSGEFFAWHVQRMVEMGQLDAADFSLVDAGREIYPWEIEEAGRRLRRRKLLMMAGGLGMALLLIVLVWWIWLPEPVHRQEPQLNEVAVAHARPKLDTVVAAKGARLQVLLPDGSKVWLNAGSELVYAHDFLQKANREVHLRGEAYFDVVHQDHHPFIIHTSAINIRVLGTVFDVRAYPDDEATVAVLLKGAIEVTFPGQPERRVILHPREKIVVPNGVGTNIQLDTLAAAAHSGYSVLPVHPMPHDTMIAEVSWVHNALAFQQESFEELARQMERWYNVQIRFVDDAPRHYQFTGIFTSESLAEALRALQLASPHQPFAYRIENQEVYIGTDAAHLMVSP